VELSWSRNTEPDMLYYAVFRKDPAGSKYLQVGSKVTQPASGKSVTFTDTTTTFNGGDFAYQVVAVRRGATTTAETSSDPSSTGSASVPAPPTSSTTPVPPGSPAGGPTTTAKPGPPAGVDLGGFLSSRAQPVALTPITVPDPPDTGFQGTLPFGARPPGDDVEDGAGQEAAASPSGSSSIVSGGSSARPLVPVAAGLILLLLAMHMTALNRRLKPAADGDLPVDLPNAIATPPVRSRRRRRGDEGPEPAAVTAAAEAAPQASSAPRFYDIGQESDWAPEPPPGPPRATAKVPRRATVKVPRRATAKVVAGPSADHTPELDETAREPRPGSRPNPVERVKRPRRTQARPTTADDLGPEPVSAPRLNVQPTAVVAAVRAYRPEPDAASEPQTPPEPWFESEGEPEAEAEAFTPPAPFAPPAEAEADLADETEFFDAGFADEIDAFDPGLADEHEVVDPELVAAIERDDDAEPDTALHPHAAVEREAGFVSEPRVAPEPRYEPESPWEPEVAMSTASGEKQATTTAEPEPELLYELEPEAEDRWADPAAADEPDPPLGDPDEIEVVEVVSPTRRHLARSGRR
jgi:hypothetical protein